MSLPYPINPNLQAVPVYQPGRPIEEVARELGLPAADIIKLASNENPLGPSRLALAAMRKALAQANLYPDGNAYYLKQKLAAKLGVTPAQLILGNGSNEVIEFVGHATAPDARGSHGAALARHLRARQPGPRPPFGRAISCLAGGLRVGSARPSDRLAHPSGDARSKVSPGTSRDSRKITLFFVE